MTIYSKNDTLDGLTLDQLDLMARSDPSFVVRFLDENSGYDAHRIRLLLELGAIEAKRRATKLKEGSESNG